MTAHSRDDIDRLLRDATALSNLQDFAGALSIVEPLALVAEDDPRVLGVLAGIYFRQDRFNDAQQCFRRATEISPKSELASLGLFHALWESGDRASAQQEVIRFLGTRDSKEYRSILEEMGWRFENGALFEESRPSTEGDDKP